MRKELVELHQLREEAGIWVLLVYQTPERLWLEPGQSGPLQTLQWALESTESVWLTWDPVSLRVQDCEQA